MSSTVTNNNLQNIKENYIKAITLYKNGHKDTAEQEFLKVLKPILSNSKIRIIPQEKIYLVKEEVLDSIYHIGLMYLSDFTKVNNFAKAAAIFQYCSKFSETYNCLLNPATFLSKAYNIEEELLNHYNININYGTLLNYCNKIKNYKKRLNNIRIEIANELYIIDRSFVNYDDWSSKIEFIYNRILSLQY